MRTRTRLTTPPDREPVDDGSRAPAERERYSPGLRPPREPRVASRYRRPLLTLAAMLVVAALAAGGYRFATSGQYQDPSLSGVSETATEG